MGFEAQEHGESFTFETDAINFGIASEIIFEGDKVLATIEASGRERADKVAVNEFARSSPRCVGTIVRDGFLASHHTTFASVGFFDALGEIHSDSHLRKLVGHSAGLNGSSEHDKVAASGSTKHCMQPKPWSPTNQARISHGIGCL